MKQRSRSALLLVGTGVVLSWLAAGCATSSDLEMLNLELSKKLDAQTRTMRAETGSLREQVKSFKGELENLRAQVGTFQLDTRSALELLKEQEVMNGQILHELSTVTTSTRKTIEGYATKMQDQSGKIESMTGEVTTQLQSVQQAVSGVKGRIEQFPPLVTALGTEVRSLTETLMGNYELEEAALKDRLRVVEEMKKRFRPLQAHEASGAGAMK